MARNSISQQQMNSNSPLDYKLNSKRISSHYMIGDNNQRTLEYEEPLSKLDKLADRIEQCPFGAWGHMHCSSCNTQLTTKPFKQCCLSNFCMDKECLKTRIRIRSMKLKDYHITSKNLYHIVIGFKAIDIKELTKEKRKEYTTIFNLIMKQLVKMYPSRYLSVRDINITKNGKIRIHHHIATLPLKDFRKFDSIIKLICNKYDGVAPSYGKYQKKTSIISYFSKRAAGDFGHNRKDEKKFGFKDMMKLEQYYNVFYGTKTFKSNFLYRVREHSEFIRMLNNIPKHCPNCGVETLLNIHFEALYEELPKPPDLIEQYSKLNIEIIKF